METTSSYSVQPQIIQPENNQPENIDVETVAIISQIVSEKRSLYHINDRLGSVEEPILSAPPEVRQIIERVLQAEKEKLHRSNPRNINDDILRIIKEEVL